MTVKNPNSLFARIKKTLLARWTDSDTPSSEKRFQALLFAKDVGIFIFLPVLTVFLFKTCENALSTKSTKRQEQGQSAKNVSFESAKSQIIDYSNSKKSASGVKQQKSSGTLVKVRLLNVVETYGGAPVHAQVMDTSLGREWFGATLLGEATADLNFNRININFTRIKNGTTSHASFQIKGRALSLNGALGLEAQKKEGFFARAALNSSNSAANEAQANLDSSDLRSFLAKALASGLMQEFGNSANVERNKSQVLTLQSGDIFFVEFTDDFVLRGNYE